jgi:alanyl-tRNA synthetase
LVLAIIKDGNPIVLSMVTPDLVNRGLHAGRIVQELSKILGGGGGGGPEMAQAGGKRCDKLGEALDKVSDIVTREVTR